jgi:hypothetical protein
MVDMGMRQQHRVDRARLKRKIAIAMLGIFAMPLVESAIEQVALAAGFQVMHGSGDRLGCAPKCNLHE